MIMAIKSYQKQGKRFFLVEVKTRGKEGKQIYRSRQGFTSIRKAEEAEFELKKIVESVASQKPLLSWKVWQEKCLMALSKIYQPSTYYTYEKCLNRYVMPVWETVDIQTLTQEEVRKLIYEQLPEGVTPHTRKATLKLVRKILQMAVDAQEIPINPCAGLTVKAPVNDQAVLNKTEVAKFLSEAKVTNHYFYPVWVTALMTGMRSGELNALLWSDVDFESKKIHVTKSWSSKNGVKPTKNERNRIVPISDDFLVFLKGLRLRTQPNEPHVLPRISHWQKGLQAKVIREFCKRIGITSIRFHDLRATFITNMLAEGVPISKVMAIVGHSQMNTTDGYNRRAGIGLEGTTDQLGYGIPTFDDSQVVSMTNFRKG
jgi:integrase